MRASAGQSEQEAEVPRIDVEGLDHVAIQVADQSASVAWYQRLLNVQTVHDDAWGGTPRMLAAPDDSGIAVFQARAGASPGVTHIAFRVTRQQYVAAKALLANEGVPFEEQDHEVCYRHISTTRTGSKWS